MKLQDLPPKAARLCLAVERFVLRELEFAPGGRELVLAYSGGADSKALFFILLALRPRLGCSLALAHLDHGLRDSSARELAEARALAAEYGLACHARRVEVAAKGTERKLGTEEAGRLARQEFFAELLAEDERRWIATGHQLNDLAEDQLMRLMRGAGWPALGGMAGLDAQRRLLRPILLTPRAELENFLGRLEQDWVRDPLNEDPAYLRNRVRADILPLFLRENPAFLKNAADLWRLARYDAEYFESASRPATPAGPLERDFLSALPRAARLRAYKQKLEQLGPGQPLLRNLLALDQAWLAGRDGKQVQFPGGKSAVSRQGGVEFLPPCPPAKL
ncbi:MAG: tRNA lysidine(34) synthetase TilS [Deltaproteobacteria bacterium]|nr:tRNA lysidine(34) synthetase TilS [Deltaproteobacteria bacterium]